MKRIPTHVEGLDSVIQGGPFEGSLILVRGAPGTGKTILVLQSLYNSALAGDVGIYFTFDETPQNLAWYAATFGWQIGALQKEKKLYIYYLGKNEYDRFRPDRLDTLRERLEYIIKSTGAKRVAIDSMTTITHYLAGVLGLHTEIDVMAVMYDVVRALNDLAKSLGIILYVVIHPDDPANLVFESVSDGVLDMFFYEDVGGVKQRGLRVSKMRATSHPLDTLSVFFERDGIEIETL
jgi:circadian clock protein KaiC